MRISQRIVAVDLSPRFARVVVLEVTLRKTEVAQVVTLEIGAEQSRAEVLARVRQVVPDPIDSFIVGADSRALSTRF